MSTDLDELLREGMGRFTEGLHVPADLLRTVVRRHRRRRLTVLAVVACGAVAVSATGLAVGLGEGGPRTEVPRGTHAAAQAHTVAYVMRRATQAAAGQRHLVEYARSVELGASGKPVPGYEVSWTHGILYTGTGSYRRADIVRGKVQTEYAYTWGRGRPVFTVVNYSTRTWDRRSFQLGAARSPAAKGCTAEPSPFDYRAFLRWGLLCSHLLRIAGTTKVDGVPAIKIVNVVLRAGPRFSWAFWVNPRTYLPVRTLLDTERTFPAVDRIDEQTDYLWLPPTSTNLAKLDVRIPAGFKQDAQMSLPSACGFLPCN
jgi:hypothetical protein